MNTPAMRVYIELETALRTGDLDTVEDLLGTAENYPNCLDPYSYQPLLHLALAWAPIDTIESLLAAGADPNFEARDGFPSLIEVIHHDSEDRPAKLRALLDAGADPNQRGVNDWTPLHAAAARDEDTSIELLLIHGADPTARTRIDDLGTPLELAEQALHEKAAAMLRAAAR